MATRQITVDDIDGTLDDVQPVQFMINGTTYSLDLGPDQRKLVVEALEPFIEYAQVSKTGRGNATTSRKPASHSSEDVAALRVWARSQGFEIGDRGRIPQVIREAYAARVQV